MLMNYVYHVRKHFLSTPGLSSLTVLQLLILLPCKKSQGNTFIPSSFSFPIFGDLVVDCQTQSLESLKQAEIQSTSDRRNTASQNKSVRQKLKI